MSYSVNGVAVVTGAGGGIGAEVAMSFAISGCRGVAFADLNEETAKIAAKKCEAKASNADFNALVVVVDVTDAASVHAMVDKVVEKFGRIDYCINAAGIGTETSNLIFDASLEEFDRIAAVNTKGTMLCCRAVSRAMKEQEPHSFDGRYGPRSLGRGSIVNLGSGNSHIAVTGKMPYTTSKHAVIGITKSAALDCAGQLIRVNAGCPSWVNTPMMSSDLKKNSALDSIIKAIVPLGRMAEPEEVADVCVFLCSPAGAYINGASLLVDDGVTLSVHHS